MTPWIDRAPDHEQVRAVMLATGARLEVRVERSRLLPSHPPWIHRFHHQGKSGVYVIAYHRHTGFWACSCRAWTTKRKCSHLEHYGFPPYELPFSNFVIIEF